MHLGIYHTIPELEQYVREISCMEIGSADIVHRFRVLPDTCVELFVNYGDKPLANIQGRMAFKNKRSLVTFRMSHFMDAQMAAGTKCVAVCFRPGMAYPFFGVSMHVLADHVIDLCDLWHAMAGEMEERLAFAQSDAERVNIVQHYLLLQLRSRPQPDKHILWCLGQIHNTEGQLRVQQLTEQVNLSQRQLSRKFNEQVGLSTKEYTRMNRFLHSLAHLKQYPAVSLTEVAYRSGYYDQAHYIMDCREYSGMSPRELALADNVLY